MVGSYWVESPSVLLVLLTCEEVEVRQPPGCYSHLALHESHWYCPDATLQCAIKSDFNGEWISKQPGSVTARVWL